MTFWPLGKPIRVVANDENQPLRFTWRGHVHRVTTIDARWRVDVEWWSKHTWRDYFRVRTDTNLLLDLYQDVLTGTWFLQREFD